MGQREARGGRCAAPEHVSALDQAGHLLAFGLFGEGAGLAVVVVAHGLQPHLVGHPQLGQHRGRAGGVVFHGGNLAGGQGLGLLCELVLQLGHGNVHGQARSAQAAHLGGRPPQHFAGHHHADAADQHGVGAAVHAGFLGRQENQGQQSGVWRLLAAAGQVFVQGLQALPKIHRLGRPQYLRHAQLQLDQSSGPRSSRLRAGAGAGAGALIFTDASSPSEVSAISICCKRPT